MGGIFSKKKPVAGTAGKKENNSSSNSNKNNNKMTKTALIVIDVQWDFLPGGSLAVPDGDKIIPIVNGMRSEYDFDCVVLTQDWHPADHMSFAKNNGKEEFSVIQVDGFDQTMWPVHCVQNSRGAEIHPDILNYNTSATNTKQHIIVQKGTNKNVDSYSAFFDNNKKQQTDLSKTLKDYNIDKVVVVGLATDYCVFYSAVDAAEAGFATVVVADGCRGIDEKTSATAYENMKQKGIKIIKIDELPQEVPKKQQQQ